MWGRVVERADFVSSPALRRPGGPSRGPRRALIALSEPAARPRLVLADADLNGSRRWSEPASRAGRCACPSSASVDASVHDSFLERSSAVRALRLCPGFGGTQALAHAAATRARARHVEDAVARGVVLAVRHRSESVRTSSSPPSSPASVPGCWRTTGDLRPWSDSRGPDEEAAVEASQRPGRPHGCRPAGDLRTGGVADGSAASAAHEIYHPLSSTDVPARGMGLRPRPRRR